MKFDMNKAWNDAVALFGRNREVILVVAGMLFLLPDFAVTMMFADVILQASLDFAAALEVVDPADLVITPAMQQALALGLVIGLIKLFGIATLLSHLSDSDRPTLGQAIGNAAKGMPTLLGAVLLFVVGYLAVGFGIGLVGGVIGLAIGVVAAGTLSNIVLLGVMFYAMVRLSMTLPTIYLDRQRNPVAALKTSWGITAKNWGRLFAFYFLLAVAYLALAWVIGGLLLPLIREVLGGGTLASAGTGLGASLLEAMVAAIFACILAAAYRQLSSHSTKGLNQTFN